MAQIYYTPTNIDYIRDVIYDPMLRTYTIPIMSYDTTSNFPNSDPVNEDPLYQKRVINNLFLRFREKWLYKDPEFRILLKYFNFERSNGKIRISIINNINDKNTKLPDDKTRKYIFRYIENVFVTKKFFEKSIRQFVKITNLKWYNLFDASDIIKAMLARKMKRLIVTTIFDIQDSALKKENDK